MINSSFKNFIIFLFLKILLRKYEKNEKMKIKK